MEKELMSVPGRTLMKICLNTMNAWTPRHARCTRLGRVNLVNSVSGGLIVRVVEDNTEVTDIVLSNVTSYVIKIPTWHEIHLSTSNSPIALHLDGSSKDFDRFYHKLEMALEMADKLNVDAVSSTSEEEFFRGLNIVHMRVERLLSSPAAGSPQTRVAPSSRCLSMPDHVAPGPPQQPPASFSSDPARPAPPIPARRQVPQDSSSAAFRPVNPRLPPGRCDGPQAKTPPDGRTGEETRIPRFVSVNKGGVQQLSDDIMLVHLDGDDDDYYEVIRMPDMGAQWKCPRCTLLNAAISYRCATCDAERPDRWLCNRCTSINHVDTAVCQACCIIRCRKCEFQNKERAPRCEMCDYKWS